MLLQATQKVAAGDLATRATPVPGGREFRELAQAFDAMAASLEKQTTERLAASMKSSAASSSELPSWNGRMKA